MGVSLVLVDDHRSYRDGLKCLFGESKDLQVIGEAGDAREALGVVAKCSPDLVVVDIGLPGLNGVGLTRELLRLEPSRRVMMLSMHYEEAFVLEALGAGAGGYAVKADAWTEIADGIRQVAAGHLYLSPRISPQVLDTLLKARRGRNPSALGIDSLSVREREVFDLLVRGYNNEAAGAELCISAKTVETHRTHIMSKLHVHSIVDLVRFAAKHRLTTEIDNPLPVTPMPERRAESGPSN
jgi:two-component system response regulator NreC